MVTQGPGNLGTGTRWGSGVAAGEAVNAAATLGGRPVGALRISGADARPRHRGVSHHSLTAYGRVALCPCDIAVPDFADDPALSGLVGAEDLSGFGRHRLVQVSLDGLRALEDSPVRLSSMGRDLAADPAYFLAAAAAGRHAAALIDWPGLTRLGEEDVDHHHQGLVRADRRRGVAVGVAVGGRITSSTRLPTVWPVSPWTIPGNRPLSAALAGSPE